MDGPSVQRATKAPNVPAPATISRIRLTPPRVRAPIPRAEEPEHEAPTDKKAIALSHANGLGDMLMTLPVAYRLKEHGYDVTLVPQSRDPRWPYPVSMAKQTHVPALPLVNTRRSGSTVVRVHSMGFPWHGGAPFVDFVLGKLEKRLGDALGGTTPRTAMLTPEAWYDAYVQRIVGARRYIVIAPRGHFRAERKAWSNKQLEAVCNWAKAHGLVPVVTGSRRFAAPGLNLSGETSLRQLCALVCRAELVATTDTGTLHLAGAFGRPIVAIAPFTIAPEAVPDYRPILWLRDHRAATIPVAAITDALDRMWQAVQVEWTTIARPRRPCGVAEYAAQLRRAGDCGDTGLPVIEYHWHDRDWWADRWPNTYIASIHAGDPRTDCTGAAAVIAHSVAAHSAWAKRRKAVYYTPLPSEPSWFSPTAWPPRRILWFGIVRKGRGLDVLAQAVEVVAETIPDIQLVIVGSRGDQPPDDMAMRLRSEHVYVHIRNYWPPAALQKWIWAADLFAFVDTDPARMEASAASAMALGAGKPVIVSDAAKHRDVSAWCYKVTPEAKALANALLALCSDRDMYAELANRALLGASYRTPPLIARQYRCIVQQIALGDGHCA